MLTINFSTRTKNGFNSRETIDNLTIKEAQKHIRKFKRLLQERTGIPNKLRGMQRTYEITKPGDRCITGWSGTLSEQHKAGFNIDLESKYLFN